jgi:hypothetical protein
MTKIISTLGLILTILLSSCSKTLPPGVYDTSDVGKVKKVASGVIVSKRAVKFHSKNADTSAPLPAGTEFIDGGRGFVYVVKLNGGGMVSIAQSEDLNLKVKQKVLIVYGKHARIMPDDGSED